MAAPVADFGRRPKWLRVAAAAVAATRKALQT
eukprot:CAMPEP_0115182326 /NCGR_PEP_ID=MMETSP0270-20121206/7887_1 /TAXON_ID=71861 /ORGANISM="Scrippsiella trochoidea, Strain CCMP3099" /LENGTH=31 /DNA_ID= /DNA_START= /DNA_END= /DNA_ORIENTATION=